MQTALFICQAMHVLTSHPKIGMQHPSLSEDLYCFDMKGEFVWHLIVLERLILYPVHAFILIEKSGTL